MFSNIATIIENPSDIREYLPSNLVEKGITGKESWTSVKEGRLKGNEKSILILVIWGNSVQLCFFYSSLIYLWELDIPWGFPQSSAGKKSIFNAGNPGLIPGSGRSPGEGIGYPLQYSWASLVAQLVKNLPAMRETWVWSLGWEDPLEKAKTTHSSTLAWRIPRTA